MTRRTVANIALALAAVVAYIAFTTIAAWAIGTATRAPKPTVTTDPNGAR